MSERFEIDVQRIVHDNASGQNAKIKPDGDGLGLVEIDGGDDYGRFVVCPEMAIHIAEAMIACAREIMAKEEAP